MKHPRSPLATALAVSMLLAFAPNPARAGCCDDFWSCLGAVATAGATCVVDAITGAAAEAALRPTINQLTKQIQDGRDSVAKAMSDREKLADDTAGRVGNELRDSKSQATNAKNRADVALWKATSAAGKSITIAPPGTTPGSGAMTPNRALTPGQSAPAGQAASSAPGNIPAAIAPPAATRGGAPAALGTANPGMASPSVAAVLHADPARVKRAMEFAHDKVGEDQTSVTKLSGQIEPQLPAAQKKAQQGTQELKPMYDKDVAAPLQNLVDRLFAFIKSPTSPSALANLISAISGEITMIVNNNVARFNTRDQTLANELNTKLAELDDGSAKAQSRTAHAETITALMEKVAQEPTVNAVKKLEQAAGVPIQAARLRAPPPADKALAPFSTGGLQQIANNLRQPPQFAMSPAGPGPHTMALNSYQSRVTSELDRLLAGKNAATAKSQFDALRAEASRRFAADPRTRDAVLRYLDNENNRYQARAPATLTPALPAVQLPAVQSPARTAPVAPRRAPGGFVK